MKEIMKEIFEHICSIAWLYYPDDCRGVGVNSRRKERNEYIWGRIGLLVNDITEEEFTELALLYREYIKEQK